MSETLSDSNLECRKLGLTSLCLIFSESVQQLSSQQRSLQSRSHRPLTWRWWLRLGAHLLAGLGPKMKKSQALIFRVQAYVLPGYLGWLAPCFRHSVNWTLADFTLKREKAADWMVRLPSPFSAPLARHAVEEKREGDWVVLRMTVPTSGVLSDELSKGRRCQTNTAKAPVK